jgi:hypothetical protein
MVKRTMTAAFALGALTTMVGGQALAGVWTEDPITGCEVWFSLEDPKTTGERL